VNPHLDALHPYPFERLNALKDGIVSSGHAPHIALSIGEPKHPAPAFLVDALADRPRLAAGLGTYPATRGSDELRAAIARWLESRFQLGAGKVDSATQVLPVSGTREALFSFAQAVLSGRSGSVCAMPNPFYQIYEGAALLRGATPWYVPCPPENEFLPDLDSVPEPVWRECELLFLCSPGNPCGAVIPLDALTRIIDLADRYDFIVASDECYSEIYRDEAHPPPGLLEACARSGRSNFRRCVVFHSLSKRSNLPGLRSGFVAGDARILERYFLYRTYHGCAMPAHVQEASRIAWLDEQHVVRNRAEYRTKFESVTPLLAALECRHPDGGFYYWPRTPIDDQAFARELFRRENVTVLPGTYLAREVAGESPGTGRVRMALVAPLAECLEAARRIARFTATL
jgi:N-succinyldiaminopimelate aminotransferase